MKPKRRLMISSSELAAALNMSSQSVRRNARIGTFPPPDVHLNQKVLRWFPDTIEQWNPDVYALIVAQESIPPDTACRVGRPR